MTGVYGTVLARGRWTEAFLAALATMVSSWAITGLLAEQPWVAPTAIALVTVALTGAAARTLRWPAPAVLLTQLAVTALVLTWLLLPGHHWFGLPRPSALDRAGELWAEAVGTIQVETVPAAATPGLVLLVVVALAVVGVAVDLLGVTLRSPALAGLPLLAVVTVTASNTGEALHPQYFLATAAAWLLLMARQGVGAVRSWGSDEGGRASADPLVARSVRRHGARARLLGGATVMLAVALPTALPHLPPTALPQGMGRSGSAQAAQVSFTETLDLSQDLASRSAQPVLRYRTDAARPAPLRVAVSTRYRDGQWQPGGAVQEEVSWSSEPMPADAPPADLAVEPEQRTVTVVENNLRAPQLAAPQPLASLDVGNIVWGLSSSTRTLLVRERPESYAVTYWSVPAGEPLPEGVGTGSGRAEAASAEELNELLTIDEASRERVISLARELTAGSSSQVQAAMAIQSYLRGRDFTYSLTLADPVNGPDGRPLDPISHFLETKQGYCTQFASAMVMMARAHGIPARLAVGFLPGETGIDGARTVVAADAHAWPELYITGLGWTRFEPTPADRSGSAPLYLTEQPTEPTGEQATAADPTVDGAAPAEVQQGGGMGGLSPSPQDPTPDGGSDLWPAVLGLAVLGVAGLLVLPVAGSWFRNTGRRRAGTAAARVEGEWHFLTATLTDLGVAGPTGATPRQVRARYQEALGLDGAAAAALDRAGERLERARYAPGDPDPAGMRDDVRRVVARARSAASPATRLRAVVWPRSGSEALRSGRAAVARALREATRPVRRAAPTALPHRRGRPPRPGRVRVPGSTP